ncbi:NADPH-dependent FMN reductase [Streptomyces lunaelactis]|uniref:NADPH-dependent FMN reductase n=1 Tax=Streptomyces lunaelactis TaxID=1535768 RepID=A0A2R4T510_9ACTN|nr:NAD(P)H-dependent oxidoreductase [Streptomyces lunaelactis]AVZ74202.1 NADPH-dependent FMN reductase [Streptomyces lunaelactis]NUK87109.1 NAD(P)H-dependent oxidoreductase [Streptomyces lunaelactis]
MRERDRSDTAPLRAAVIIGSTREGRAGEKVGRWFMERAAARDDLELAVVDLVDFDFPARYPDRATEQMREFSTEVGRADAFVVAVEQLRSVFTELHTVTLRNGVSINLLDEALDDRDRAAGLMLDQLGWWGLALREARAARPYVS